MIDDIHSFLRREDGPYRSLRTEVPVSVSFSMVSNRDQFQIDQSPQIAGTADAGPHRHAFAPRHTPENTGKRKKKFADTTPASASLLPKGIPYFLQFSVPDLAIVRWMLMKSDQQ